MMKKKRKASPRPGKLGQRSKRLVAAGALTTSLITSTGLVTGPVEAKPDNVIEREKITLDELRKRLAESLAAFLPKKPGRLTPNQERMFRKLIKELFGIDASAELEGQRLNQTFGLIGREQHLKRYPGDTLDQHGEFLEAGLAPNTGAWGYFTPSKEALTQDLANKERYYVAVQTFYLKDWVARQPEIKKWYQYRKVVVVNPATGQAVVAVIGDAGPARWTGKVFGGSPEVIHHLGLDTGIHKGEVVLFSSMTPRTRSPSAQSVFPQAIFTKQGKFCYYKRGKYQWRVV